MGEGKRMEEGKYMRERRGRKGEKEGEDKKRDF